MTHHRFARSSVVLRRARQENIALLPASHLLYKDQWKIIANGLPQENVLVILPRIGCPSRRAAELTTALLQARGHRITIISS